MSRPTKPKPRGDRPRLALVLSGGGARGAYEAGILRYLREDLAGDLGGQVQFDILCGTSVGGIHACFVAGTCDIPARQGRMRPVAGIDDGDHHFGTSDRNIPRGKSADGGGTITEVRLLTDELVVGNEVRLQPPVLP